MRNQRHQLRNGEVFKKKLSELQDYRTNLSSANLEDFKRLKAEILSLLNDNQRIRFNQIIFYLEKKELTDMSTDDLPF